MTDKILIDRSVVEQALEDLQCTAYPQDYYETVLELRAALEQPDTEPVAYEFYNPATGHAIVDYSEHTHVGHLSADKGYIANPLFHPQPPRQPLTEDQIFNAIRSFYSSDVTCKAAIRLTVDEYRAIEQAHGIKE